MIRDTFSGPKPMHDAEGFAVVEFGRHPDCEELPPDFTVSVLGWGSRLLATGTDLEELARYAESRFPKVRVAIGSPDPLGWGEAKW